MGRYIRVWPIFDRSRTAPMGFIVYYSDTRTWLIGSTSHSEARKFLDVLGTTHRIVEANASDEALNITTWDFGVEPPLYPRIGVFPWIYSYLPVPVQRYPFRHQGGGPHRLLTLRLAFLSGDGTDETNNRAYRLANNVLIVPSLTIPNFFDLHDQAETKYPDSSVSARYLSVVGQDFKMQYPPVIDSKVGSEGSARLYLAERGFEVLEADDDCFQEDDGVDIASDGAIMQL
jgi:hypothetical protein